MSATNSLPPNAIRKPRALRWKNGKWYMDTARYGRRLAGSTGTADLQEAQRYLQRAMSEVVSPVDAACFQQTSVQGGPSWPQLPTGEDEASQRLRAEILASEQWALRVRGLVNGLKKGKALATVAAAYDLDYVEALRWMCDHRKAWIAELFDGVETRRRA